MLKNKKNKPDHSIALHLLGAIAWVSVILAGHYHLANAAASSNQPSSSSSDTFIQSYGSSVALQPGMIVQLEKGNTNAVVPASQSNVYGTFGIVVNLNDATIAVQDQNNSSRQIFVANTGHYRVLVSDQNGPIKEGDYVTLSSLDGIGMDDNATEPIVVAQALTAFNGTGPLVSTDTIKTSSGTETVHIGLINASIAIAHNPKQSSSNNSIPKILQGFSQTLTGKVVSPWRIWLGVSVLAVVAFIVGSMLFAAVRSALISIGRNPLSKRVITKGFIEVVLAGLIIFTSAIFGVYLLLKV